MFKRKLNLILIVLLLIDVAYSFNQHLHMKLDGDLHRVVLRDSDCNKVLDDPFGLSVVLEHKSYVGPNRFFAQWMGYAYFRSAPFLFQFFADPIDSIYLSCAFAKIAIQLFIIALLSFYISFFKSLKLKEFLMAAVLVTPLFQTSGYNSYMGIIDESVSYNFSYSLPFGLLLLFFLPFYRAGLKGGTYKFNFVTKVLLIILSVILAFSGALLPGVILLICPMILFNKCYANFVVAPANSFFKRIIFSLKEIPGQMLFYFIGICILSSYSLYVGFHNSENFIDNVPLMERYARVPAGLYYLLTQKIGIPLLLIMIFLNTIIIKKMYNDGEGKKIVNLFKWIGIFSAAYILLIPIGGFRIYRENILRYDTIMPITIALIFIYGLSTIFLINNIALKYKWAYLSGIILFSLIYTNADRLEDANYLCEREAIEKIAASPDKIVELNNNCTVLSWGIITDYRESELNAQVLQYWGVTKEKKLYYQK